MAFAQQPNYDNTASRTYYEHQVGQRAKEVRWKLMQQKFAFIEKVICLPSGFAKCRALIHLPDISQRTFIGQHVFSLRKGRIILELPTGPVVLASTEERAPTWCLEYDPEFYGGQLSSFTTGHATISPSYDSTSTEDMESFRTMKEYYQKAKFRNV